VKKLLAQSVVVALLLGSLVGFVDYVASVHGASKYDPPITAEEGRQLGELPMDKAVAAMAARRRILTRREWVAESIGYSYFWRGVAKDSIVPILGVFIACVFVGRLQMRAGGPQ
jgi:hypothetical protein